MSLGYGETRSVTGAEVVPLNSSWEARERMAALANSGQPFTNNGGTVTGQPGPTLQFGWLPSQYRRLAATATYVIWSFGTPIAMRRADGIWDIPAVKYSSRTTKHQGFCRVHLGIYEDR